MQTIKRYLPLIATAFLALAVGLRAFGMEEAARAVETLGGLVGMTSSPAVSYAELVAAGAAAAGVTLKIVAEIRKARNAANTVSTAGR